MAVPEVVDTPPPRSAGYRFVEGLHLRQWALRAVLPVSVLCTNGAGPLDVAWWPRHDVVAGAWTGGLLPCSVLFVAVSAWVRVASKGVLVRKTELTTGGIYRRVRHPFYLANLLGAVGTLLLAGALGALACGVWFVAALPIYWFTIRGEEEGLGNLYPEAWDRYAARVPALIPIPGRRGDAGAEPARIGWGNLVREREPPRFLRFVGGALAVAGCAGPGRMALVGVAAGCFAVSYVLPTLTGSRRRRPN